MNLILDEWIVREVIDTLYMARATFLGITGLDSPQEVEKKSANETAITRRISKAIDIIQQSEQSPVPNDLEEAADEMALRAFPEKKSYSTVIDRVVDYNGLDRKIYRDGIIAGAKWQKEQDERIYREFFNERNQGDASFRDLLAYKEGHSDGMEEQKAQMMDEWLKDRDGCFWDGVAEGKKAMKEQMMKEAVAVEVVGDKRDLRLIDSTQRCLFNAKRGDWLKIIIVKE